jgi:hypothetical protein
LWVNWDVQPHFTHHEAHEGHEGFGYLRIKIPSSRTPREDSTWK